jgi:hypothetical protein
MRRLLVVVVLLALACSSAMAVSPSNRPEAKPAGTIYEGGIRQGGDDVSSAMPIASLPYYDSGVTAGYINDYDEVCPYTGSTSPDVVYSFVPGADVSITVDLCASSYDTKVYIYQNAVGNLIACNDDAGCGYSGWQSLVENIALVGGNTYYIVVDGYGGSSGEYVMAIDAYEPCVLVCPDGALIEGEPPCVDNYWDTFNGGCNSEGWTEVGAVPGTDCADVCAKSCTYIYQGLSYRDTDWYTVTAVGGTVTYTLEAEFPVLGFLFYGLDCGNLQGASGSSGACVPVSMNWNASAGQELWVWAGPSVFSGIAESDYIFSVCGIQTTDPVPTETKSWGQIKNSYR